MKCRRIPYYECKEGIYEIDEFDCACVFVIIGENRALVLDTGTGIGDLRWVIENKITDKPYDVVITHNHGDHVGGAGFFEEVWVHPADMDWDSAAVGPSMQFRRDYASLIAAREGKYYAYESNRDIEEWPQQPKKKELRDKQIFDLGGRKVTIYHCPGHTMGECVAIDDLTQTLFLGDACNCNLLLAEDDSEQKWGAVQAARQALQKIWDKKGIEFTEAYNSHHDFRGFGSPLADCVIPDALECLRRMEDGTAEILQVPDPLSSEGSVKNVAAYGSVRISLLSH